MSHFRSVIRELESALDSGTTQQRVDVLRQVTNLFVSGTENFSERQISMFGEVMSHLIKHIEDRALAELSTRLAPIPNAPAEVIRRLAKDDAIGVSGPVLAKSPRLTDEDLVEIARTKSQAHLVKIAGRPQLSEAVTDVLVDRGDAAVANEVAANSGARFSRAGYSMLVMRADGDDALTAMVARRADIPALLFRQLLTRATETVRQRLLAGARPEAQSAIREILAQISTQVDKGLQRRDYADVQKLLQSFSQDTELTRSKLLQFANSQRVPEMVAALSALSALSIDLIDRLVYNTSHFGIMVLCKAIELDWMFANAVVLAQQGRIGAQTLDLEQALDFEEVREEYNKLSVSSAQRLLRFWQVRQKAEPAR
jgi:uncharacterized protein (DUF2336 family)